jgi:hypothetical protein
MSIFWMSKFIKPLKRARIWKAKLLRHAGRMPPLTGPCQPVMRHPNPRLSQAGNIPGNTRASPHEMTQATSRGERLVAGALAGRIF